MLCQSCLHTASKIFVHKNKIESGSIFCIFVSVAFWKDGQYKKTDKTHAINFRLRVQLPLLVSEKKDWNSILS